MSKPKVTLRLNKTVVDARNHKDVTRRRRRVPLEDKVILDRSTYRIFYQRMKKQEEADRAEGQPDNDDDEKEHA